MTSIIETQFINADSQSKRQQGIWQMFLLLTAVSVLLLNRSLTSHASLCVILLLITCTVCIRTVRLLPRLGNDLFDPGFLFIMFVSVSILPVGLALLLGINLMAPYSTRVHIDDVLLSKSIVMHIIVLCFTTLTYVLLSGGIKPKPYAGTEGNDHKLLSHKVWLLIYISFFIIVLTIKYLTGALYTREFGASGDVNLALRMQRGLFSDQIISTVARIASIAAIFAFGMLVSRAGTLGRARLLLFLLTGVMFAYSFYFFASRGPAIIFFTAGAYADRVKWKGQLFSWRFFLIVFLGGWVGMHAVNMLEIYILSGGYISNKWAVQLFTALEPQVVRNSCVVINWVDTLEVPLRYGETYWDALKTLIPAQILGERIDTLATWFAWTYSPVAAGQGAGYNFSMIAEGYLNGKVFGVVIESIIVGVFLYGFARIRMSRRLGCMGPVLYACSIPWIYKLYKREAFLLIEVMLRNAVYVGFLLCLAVVLIRLGKREPGLSVSHESGLLAVE